MICKFITQITTTKDLYSKTTTIITTILNFKLLENLNNSITTLENKLQDLIIYTDSVRTLDKTVAVNKKLTNMSYLSSISKIQKCQSATGGETDLIQTDLSPSGMLARQQIKNNKISKTQIQIIKNSTNVTIAHENKLTEIFSQQKVFTKTTKCQPSAGGRPDLIQTESAPNRGLARHKLKKKSNQKYLSNVTIVKNNTGKSLLSKICTKTKKCQPPAWGRPDLIQTEPAPNRGLARPQNKKNKNTKTKVRNTQDNSDVTLNIKDKYTSPVDKIQVCKKTKKCQPPAGDMSDLIQTAHVPNRGLARPKNKNKQNVKNKIKIKNWALTHKKMNKIVKTKNGNVNARKSLKIIHWNMGSKFWDKKNY